MVAKQKYLALTLFFSFMFALAMVSAAVTFIAPSSTGSTATGSYLFNVTTNLANTENCTFATTADGVFNVTVNDTTSDTVFNVTFDTTTLTDAEDTTLTVICNNTTGSTQTNTLVINVDNTAPVCSFLIDRNTVDFQDGIGVETTQSSTDTTDLTYLWTLYRSDDTSSTTSTSTAPTFSGSDFDQVDEFTLALVITDEASKSTACTNQTILVSGSNGDGTVAVAELTTFVEERKTEMIVGILVLFLLLVAVAGYFIIINGKK